MSSFNLSIVYVDRLHTIDDYMQLMITYNDKLDKLLDYIIW